VGTLRSTSGGKENWCQINLCLLWRGEGNGMGSYLPVRGMASAEVFLAWTAVGLGPRFCLVLGRSVQSSIESFPSTPASWVWVVSSASSAQSFVFARKTCSLGDLPEPSVSYPCRLCPVQLENAGSGSFSAECQPRWGCPGLPLN
jgi:hypothetical protein